MNVNLGQQFDSFVEELLKTGRYQSQSEVIRDALRLLQDREDLRKVRSEELRRTINEGMNAIQRGEISDWNLDDMKSKARQHKTRKEKSR